VSRRLAALLVALVGLLALAMPTAHAAEAPQKDPTRDPLTVAQQRLDEIRGQATDIAARISAAETQQATLTAEIAEAEAKIPALKAKADELRELVKERAAQLYVRNGAANRFESTMDAESTEDGLRAAHLTDTIGAADLNTATELKETAAKLTAREAELRDQRAQLGKTLADLAPLNDALQQKLKSATDLYDKVRALVVDGKALFGADLTTGAAVCPVKGLTVFTDDFAQVRDGGAHPGIDMAAVTDTPVVAVTDGVWRRDVGGAGGNGAWLTGFDGFSYYYAHFSHYEDLTPEGLVKAGTVIGFVGMTGNATGPHLHFEIHPGVPGQNPPVDPYATLLALCDAGAPPAKAN
jgi:murein DD-endopeptidase MepM/ murein hydrolase activator NlpD